MLKAGGLTLNAEFRKAFFPNNLEQYEVRGERFAFRVLAYNILLISIKIVKLIPKVLTIQSGLFCFTVHVVYKMHGCIILHQRTKNESATVLYFG